ncbi:type II toxin-antitoxin system VapC family toxin [Natronorubrum texcoconense]|uniref:Ribonuclease VapC n=1 Tax=Natronorubrum texcoconense TaxID=1095776 RepID=A0A1G9FD48_9EURY|nr:type II toxin-antitoxin system VapC family toxin [Natronorubrum texcoconense]SDK86280.1 Predicted nucleic acid-binding protein, contains PIN domain [Natronorubrum texcoconense]
MYCLDANVWIYFLDQSLEEHDDVASVVVPLLEAKPLFTTTVLQMEVVHYLHTQLSEPMSAIDRFLALEDVFVADLTPRDVESGATMLQTYPHTGIGGRDATVLAAMRRHDVSHLWTHDTGLKRTAAELEWLEVFDPVEAEAESR